MILETIVTSLSPVGAVNAAPMGVEWDESRIVLKPFLDTTTWRNVTATGAAVVNLTDDVRVFARGAIGGPVGPTIPATVVEGVVLADACGWRELRVTDVQATSPRGRIETAIVHRATGRECLVFNRARHAVLELAIHATRLHLLEPAFIDAEVARLQVIVDKTAGPDEHEAMALLVDHIHARRHAAPLDAH